MTPTAQKDEVLGILYHRAYQIWRQADEKSMKRKSELLAIFQQRMVAAGYTSEEIQAIERKALRELDDLERSWNIGDDDTEPYHGLDLRDMDEGGR